MTLSVRLKLFIGSMAAAALAVLTMAALVPWQLRVQERESIQRRLADESKLIADLLSSAQTLREGDMDREADRLGRWSRAVSRSSPATAGWSATRRRRRPSCRGSRTTPRGPR